MTHIPITFDRLREHPGTLMRYRLHIKLMRTFNGECKGGSHFGIETGNDYRVEGP